MGWQEKLKNSTYQRVARKAGVRNLDSRNDVRKIKAYLAKNPKLTQERYIKNAKAAPKVRMGVMCPPCQMVSKAVTKRQPCRQ